MATNGQDTSSINCRGLIESPVPSWYLTPAAEKNTAVYSWRAVARTKSKLIQK